MSFAASSIAIFNVSANTVKLDDVAVAETFTPFILTETVSPIAKVAAELVAAKLIVDFCATVPPWSNPKLAADKP